MTTRFDTIVEQWATVYKPMLHSANEEDRNKRFFRLGSEKQIVDFTQQMTSVGSPCVGYVTRISGRFTDKFKLPEHVVYFFVKTTNSMDELCNANAVYEAEMHAEKFLAWIHQNRETIPALKNIDLRETPYGSFGPIYNNWMVLHMSFGDVTKRTLCVNQDDYKIEP